MVEWENKWSKQWGSFSEMSSANPPCLENLIELNIYIQSSHTPEAWKHQDWLNQILIKDQL